MLFDTPVSFVFLTLVVLIYWRLSWRGQNKFLLAASYFFYGWWDWRFLLLMVFSTVVDYSISKAISSSFGALRRKRLLIISIVLNFAILGFFKYFNFFADSMATLLETLGVHNIPHGLLNVVLPPAISFYTFQEVAYIVDVYFYRVEAAESLIDYALFISLFPHLIAGPIQRPSHLLPQVQRPRTYDPRAFFDGMMLIISGLFRKCIIADQCAPLANAAFGGRFGTGFWATLIGVFAFSWQIYGDFSGYSDIARGSAQLLGFHFMVNFRQPYLSSSLQDFWRRWHISLSTWLRDYLYIPLGGNRKGERRTYINLLTTMVLGGLWHGANWTFVVWGALHGGWLAIERVFTRGNEVAATLSRWALRAATLSVVAIAWVFFRATSVHQAISMLATVTNLTWAENYGPALLFLAVLSAAMMAMDLRLERAGEEYVFQKRSVQQRIVAAGAMTALVIVFAASKTSAFIYFQF